MSVIVYFSNNGWVTSSVLYSTDMVGSNDVLLNPKIKNEVNKTGSFTFTILSNHSKYDKLYKMKTQLKVVRDNSILFIGRVLDIKTDFYKQRNVTCEGSLSFLLDSVYPPLESATMTVQSLFRSIISNHNTMVEDAKQFTVGQITIPKANVSEQFEITSYGKTSDVIDSELLQVYGGVLRVRNVGSTNYIDWIADPIDNINSYSINSQSIEYSVNMLDLEEEYPVDDLFTVLLPIGKDKLTLSGNKYLTNTAAVELYGKIVHAEQWTDIENESELRNFGQMYLDQHSGVLPDDLIIKTVDLHVLDSKVQQLQILDRVRVYSEPHNIDTVMVCLVAEYDIQNPENDSFRIGTFVKANKRKKTPVKSSSRSRGGSGRSGRSSGLSGKSANLSGDVESFSKEAKEDILVNANNISVNAENIAVNATNIAINASDIVSINGRKIVIDGEEVSINANEIDITGEIKNMVVNHLDASTATADKWFKGRTIVTDGLICGGNDITCVDGGKIIGENGIYMGEAGNRSLVATRTDISNFGLTSESNLLRSSNVYFGNLYVERSNSYIQVATTSDLTWGNVSGKPNFYDTTVKINGSTYHFWTKNSYSTITID